MCIHQFEKISDDAPPELEGKYLCKKCGNVQGTKAYIIDCGTYPIELLMNQEQYEEKSP